MDPILTNRIDPALLRVIDKRGNERDTPSGRRRPTRPPEKNDAEGEETPENVEHELDDLA